MVRLESLKNPLSSQQWTLCKAAYKDLIRSRTLRIRYQIGDNILDWRLVGAEVKYDGVRELGHISPFVVDTPFAYFRHDAIS